MPTRNWEEKTDKKMWLGYFNLAPFGKEIIMLVSVVIGLLNEEKFLPRLIEDFKKSNI